MAKLEPAISDHLSSSTLFPILPSGPSGLARLAAKATHAEDGHLIEFRAIQSRSILNKSVSKRQLSLAYSINPFRRRIWK